MDRSRVDLLFQTEELRTLKLSTRDRLLRRENLWKLKRVERAAARELTATVVCGPDDEVFMRQHVRADAPILVLANGCDATFFAQEKWPPRPAPVPTWLFCGAMDYSPNVDGISWYFREADDAVRSALPNRVVKIVGKNPNATVKALAAIPGVVVTGEVPDVRPHYQDSWFQIVPLRIGGGTRLKIVESLCIGCPVLSTTIGAQGLELRDGEHILLADTPADFAAGAVRLANDGDLRERLRRAGRKQVLSLYGWPTLATKLQGYYESLIAKS
jgi:glycosyltransferase involved in cell wall biosynthesis